MSEGVLTVLKFCLLALVYLFLARVVWVVGLELRGTPVAADVPPEPAPSRSSRRRSYRLTIVEPATERGSAYVVDGELTIGRAGGCHITLSSDTFVSQVHARVFERDGDAYLEDLGSTNGTFLNGAQVTETTRLKRGDHVQIGETEFEVAR
jgi:hypothetical protein